jgi:acetoin utilization deacetylase AcuC-like enzyme
MTTALITHPDCLDHVTPPGHPEQVARLEYILTALETPEFAALDRQTAPLAPDDDLLRVHPPGYIQSIRDALPDAGWVSLDADTHMSPGSLDAALRAAGGVLQAVDMVLSGTAANALGACRPPGHHAETSTAMGFCLFGNIAIAAKNALDHHGLNRVAIVDFDVHHGNGTQDLVEDDARILFVSSHQMPFYPGTGAAHETGAHNNVLNMPLSPGSGSAAFRQVWQSQAFPAIAAHRPELILVSAGFDAHAADPLAQLNLRTEDFTWITQALCDLADEHCGGKLVSTLEGGYDLDALAASVAAHMRVLMERGQ